VPPISRRAFLAASGGLLVVVAAACGSEGEDSNDDDAAASNQLVALRLSADQYASPEPQRFAYALTKGNRYFDGPPSQVAFGTPEVFATLEEGQDASVIPDSELTSFVETTLRAEGLPENRGVYDTEATFPQDGFWFGRIKVEGESVDLPFEVNAIPEGLIPGEAAPRAASPTPTDPLDVDPICTRAPGCGLHTKSLAQVVGTGKPVAIMFATPAHCESQYCQPVLDLLLDLREEFRDRVDLVHVEIYRSDTSRELVPTLEPWEILTEPWLYGVDGAGTITERLGGAFDRSQVRELLQRLAG